MFLTSFVGRQDEIALASALLRRPDLRLLTLTGPGGIGKTRLANEIATASLEVFPDGIRFVPLASVQDQAMVMVAVATSLGVQEFDGPSIDDAVAAAVGSTRLLLVLDNFEHVLAAAPALTRLLTRCPHLTILVTSRSLLRVEGEHSIPVPPFTLPRPRTPMNEPDCREVPVVRLFMERARALNPALEWNADNLRDLVQICGRLDGLPLAIELAATRARHFSLAELNDRLNDLLPVLVDGSRDHPSRLQTMRNAIAWSHDLLAADSQALMRRASVFNGGFTLDAIAGVFRSLEAESLQAQPDGPADGRVDPARLASIEQGLAILVDSSLLVREPVPGAGTTRYRFLETIREFAWDQLELAGEAAPLRRGHAAFFAGYAAEREIAELIPEHIRFVDDLVAEQDNLRSALAWLADSSDIAVFEALVAALGPFWLAQSNYQEGKTWCERALAVQTAPVSAASAKILVSLGMTELFLEETGLAESHLARGVDACREHDEAHRQALGLIGLAGLAIDRGDGEESTQLLEGARTAVAAIADARVAGVMSGWISINLAVTARSTGKVDLATSHIEDALARFRAEQFDAGIMMALGDLGDLARDRGDWSRALSLYREALLAGRTGQAKRLVIEIVESVAILAVQTGQLERSATLFGAAEGLRDRIGLRYRPPRGRTSLDEATAAIRGGIPGDAFLEAWQAGRNLTEPDTIAAVLDLDDVPAPQPGFSLTARETQILGLLATGMTDPEIADDLFISVRTVEHHVASLFRKLGVRTRSAATATAIAAGLVST